MYNSLQVSLFETFSDDDPKCFSQLWKLSKTSIVLAVILTQTLLSFEWLTDLIILIEAANVPIRFHKKERKEEYLRDPGNHLLSTLTNYRGIVSMATPSMVASIYYLISSPIQPDMNQWKFHTYIETNCS